VLRLLREWFMFVSGTDTSTATRTTAGKDQLAQVSPGLQSLVQASHYMTRARESVHPVQCKSTEHMYRIRSATFTGLTPRLHTALLKVKWISNSAQPRLHSSATYDIAPRCGCVTTWRRPKTYLSFEIDHTLIRVSLRPRKCCPSQEDLASCTLA
jgi:hypothetical protein